MSKYKCMVKRKPSIRSSQLVFSTKRFVILYLLYMAAMMLFLTKSVSSWFNLDEKFGITMAVCCSRILSWFRIPCHTEGIILHLPSSSLAINFGCNGLEAIMILAAGILAFPGTWKRKAAGLFVGAMLLQTFNIFRIVLLAVSSMYFPSAFEIIHIYIAQGIMIIISLILFLIYVLRNPKQHAV